MVFRGTDRTGQAGPMHGDALGRLAVGYDRPGGVVSRSRLRDRETDKIPEGRPPNSCLSPEKPSRGASTY